MDGSISKLSECATACHSLENWQMRFSASALTKASYYKSVTTPGLWRHKWCPIIFGLIVDDFRIEYVGKLHSHHLLQTLQEHYTITTDWEEKIAGVEHNWTHATKQSDCKCRLSIKGHIEKVLLKYGHIKPTHPQLTPHKHREIKQLIPVDDTSPDTNAMGVKRIQAIIGELLYYARNVDNNVLVALSAIGDQQAASTEDTTDAIKQLLYYAITYPNDGIIYPASNTVLSSHSDAGFNNESKRCSCAGAHIFYLRMTLNLDGMDLSSPFTKLLN